MRRATDVEKREVWNSIIIYMTINMMWSTIYYGYFNIYSERGAHVSYHFHGPYSFILAPRLNKSCQLSASLMVMDFFARFCLSIPFDKFVIEDPESFMHG